MNVTTALMVLPAVGTFILGFSIGYLIRFFLIRISVFRIVDLTAIIAVVMGGAIASFVMSDEVGQAVRWWYPMGLLLGWTVHVLIGRLDR